MTSQKTFIILLTILIVSVLLNGYLSYLYFSKPTPPLNPLALNNKLPEAKPLPTKTITDDKGNKVEIIDVCRVEPTIGPDGRKIFIVDSTKYSNSNFLGELFTVSDCDTKLVSQVYGVTNSMYTLNPVIETSATVNSKMIQTLKEIGFTNNGSCRSSDPKCSSWQLTKAVPVDSILRLKSLANDFLVINCLNCK